MEQGWGKSRSRRINTMLIPKPRFFLYIHEKKKNPETVDMEVSRYFPGRMEERITYSFQWNKNLKKK